MGIRSFYGRAEDSCWQKMSL